MSSAPRDGLAEAPRDRRRAHRAGVDIPAIMHTGERETACTIIDISTQGMSLSDRGDTVPDSVVRVVFRLPTNLRQPIDVVGLVVRRQAGAGSATVGLRFIEPSNHVIAAIETYVARNRSDLPFSSPGANGGGGARSMEDTTERELNLKDLYKIAVRGSDEKDRARGGFFGRWRRKGR